MPSILEQVQPSWIEDGWGIQGDQNEVRFDDDIPWDITAWTRDHPDESDFNCCAPSGCPSVTFSELEFCCFPTILQPLPFGGLGACCDDVSHGCSGVITAEECTALGAGHSFHEGAPCKWMQIQSPSPMTDVPFGMSGDETLGDCTHICFRSPICAINTVREYHVPPLSCPATGCEGTYDEFGLAFQMHVAFVDGLWHILLWGGSNAIIYFYGTTSDIGIPAENEVVCGELSNWSGPFFDCTIGAQDLLGVSSGGAATLGATIALGACCSIFGDCLDAFEDDCINPDCLNGTFIGEGIPCDPNPC